MAAPVLLGRLFASRRVAVSSGPKLDVDADYLKRGSSNRNVFKMDSSQEPFDSLLFRLEPGRPDSKARYGRLRFKMIRYFEWKCCQDAEDLADETISRAVKQVLEGKEIVAENPYFYFYGVAKNIYKEYVRTQIKKESILKMLPAQQSSLSGSWQDCRIQCLRRLSADSLGILQGYYLEPDDRELLAEQSGLTLNALRLRVHRLKCELRDCYDNCREKSSTGRKLS
jgi:DNA-directed RNA polymerase specialized sigma24 family protein